MVMCFISEKKSDEERFRQTGCRRIWGDSPPRNHPDRPGRYFPCRLPVRQASDHGQKDLNEKSKY